jgi:hypothetical protein
MGGRWGYGRNRGNLSGRSFYISLVVKEYVIEVEKTREVYEAWREIYAER